METQEIWEDVGGYEGLYKVSIFGRVKSLDRVITICRNGKYIKYFQNGRIIRNGNRQEYLSVTLYLQNKRTTYNVHRLVAQAFIPNPENKRTVNHKNGIKNDNRAENLEWATYSENEKHAYNYGLKFNDIGAKDSQSIQISQYTLDGKWIRNWGSAKQVQRELGFSQGNISKCVKGHPKYKTSYGFIWQKFKQE
jgi:hypothetical protein